MNRQDVDPMADVVPPRHAYESDDEDEFDPRAASLGQPGLRGGAQDTPSLTLDLPQTVHGSKEPLLIALGPLGKAWAKGANLGESVGRIGLDKVGYLAVIFRPSWFKGHVLVADIPTKLGDQIAWSLADSVARYWSDCKSVIIVDAYDAVNYRSIQGPTGPDDPTRFLGSGLGSETRKLVEEFTPPNLLQGPIAAFINKLTKSALVEASSLNILAVLVPSREYNHARVLSRNSKWSSELLKATHRIVSASLPSSTSNTWTPDEKDKSMRPFAFRDDGTLDKKSNAAHEMNMYI